MRVTGLVLGGFCAVLFAMLAVSGFLNGRWVVGALLLVAALLCTPLGARPFRGVGQPLAMVLRLFATVFLALTAATPLIFPDPRTSIYDSPEVRARFQDIYDRKLDQWPVEPDTRFLETERGRVHVLSAGPEDAPPLLLLHAAGVASWSWGPNIAALSEAYRVHAVDLIGDAGRSELADISKRLGGGEDQADHYAEVMDLLGIGAAPVVGASEGGFIATNLALHHPARVERMVLLGPMGYAGAVGPVLRIFVTQLFPLPPLRRATFRRVFSDDPELVAEYEDWFRLVMTGLSPAKVPPLPFSAEERQSIEIPVLYVFGTRDRLVGDAEAARAQVADVPEARVEIVEAGHLMAAEAPERINALILDFLSAD